MQDQERIAHRNMNTLDYILDKYNVRNEESPIKLNYHRTVGIPTLFRELGFTKGAEIGVEQGKFSELLLKKIPNLKLYSIDFWQYYRLWRGMKRKWRQDIYYENVKKKLASYNCEVIKATSMNAVKNFEDESLDFVYIDANHNYECVKEDIREWSKKVRKGGIVSGDDYYIFPSGNDGVVKAVDEWIKDNKIKPWFYFYYLGKPPNWFYVKI